MVEDPTSSGLDWTEAAQNKIDFSPAEWEKPGRSR
jgi:hypothetical protein